MTDHRPADAASALGVTLLLWQANFLEAALGWRKSGPGWRNADTHAESPSEDARARVLVAKQHRGKGPPASANWRGRGRTTKYKTR
jgi:hypothetical protein